MVVPPLPTTSKSSVPPERVRALLIEIFPPVLGAIPKVPVLIEKAEAFASEMVSRSPVSIAPAVVYINGVAALNERILVTTLVVKVTELVPERILSAPIVWFGELAMVSGDVALKASMSFAAGVVLTGDQFELNW